MSHDETNKLVLAVSMFNIRDPFYKILNAS